MFRGRRHSGVRISPVTRAFWVLLLLVLGVQQVGESIHQSLVQHSPCPEDGNLSHEVGAGARTEVSQVAAGYPVEATGKHADHCWVLCSQRRTSHRFPGPVIHIERVEVDSFHSHPAMTTGLVARISHLRLAPKNSPPA